MKQIAEEQVTPQIASQVAPDVISPQGQQQLAAKRIGANKIKSVLDKALGLAAEKLGGTFSSRIKDQDTMIKKTIQKRLGGRDYNISDINDTYGGRLLVDKSDIGKAKDEVREMSRAGLFSIKKEQDVKDGEYRGYHFDIQTPTGDKGEIQVHTPQSALEAVSNHTTRGQFGDKPQSPIATFQAAQADKAHGLPNEKAYAALQSLQALEKKQNGQINPVQSALILASQAQK